MNHNVSQNGQGHWNPSDLFLDSGMICEHKRLIVLGNEWVKNASRYLSQGEP